MYDDIQEWKEDKPYRSREVVTENVGGEVYAYMSLHGEETVPYANKGNSPSISPANWSLLQAT